MFFKPCIILTCTTIKTMLYKLPLDNITFIMSTICQTQVDRHCQRLQEFLTLVVSEVNLASSNTSCIAQTLAVSNRCWQLKIIDIFSELFFGNVKWTLCG